MSLPGGAELLVVARSVPLDAFEALADHRNALVLIGAQAIYLHTGAVSTALPEATRESDLAIDRRQLADDPLLEEAMSRAGFVLGKDLGSWLGAMDVPVDLMIPESMSGPGGRRGGLDDKDAHDVYRLLAGVYAGPRARTRDAVGQRARCERDPTRA